MSGELKILKEEIDWNNTSDGVKNFAAKLGIGPNYTPSPIRLRSCPKCDSDEVRVREAHADTSMSYMEGKCKVCKYCDDLEYFKQLDTPFKYEKSDDDWWIVREGTTILGYITQLESKARKPFAWIIKKINGHMLRGTTFSTKTKASNYLKTTIPTGDNNE
jgi:hypothetical protein